jgi:hypothetical protein
MTTSVFHVGEVEFDPVIEGGRLHSLGAVRIGGTALRNPATRFLPWFDSSVTRFRRERTSSQTVNQCPRPAFTTPARCAAGR